MDPNNSDAYVYRGDSNTKLNKYEQGLRNCNIAIKMNEKNVRVFNIRGNIYYKFEYYEKALADYTTAIQINPK